MKALVVAILIALFLPGVCCSQDKLDFTPGPISVAAGFNSSFVHFPEALSWPTALFRTTKMFSGNGLYGSVSKHFGEHFNLELSFRSFSADKIYGRDEDRRYKLQGFQLPLVFHLMPFERHKIFTGSLGLGCQYLRAALTQYETPDATTAIAAAARSRVQIILNLQLWVRIARPLYFSLGGNFALSNGYSGAINLSLRYTFSKTEPANDE